MRWNYKRKIPQKREKKKDKNKNKVEVIVVKENISLEDIKIMFEGIHTKDALQMLHDLRSEQWQKN